MYSHRFQHDKPQAGRQTKSVTVQHKGHYLNSTTVFFLKLVEFASCVLPDIARLKCKYLKDAGNTKGSIVPEGNVANI